MAHLLIIAHTPSTNTTQLADALLQGCHAAQEATLDIRVASPFKVDASQVQSAKGIILFTPENFGYMSGALKDFFERIYYPCLEATQGLPYCLCVRAGQDGTGTVASVERIVTGLRWQQAQPPLVCQGAFQETFIDQAKDYAEGFALGLALGVF